MKFAFSTSCCPQWDWPAIAVMARELGYDGVETADVPPFKPAVEIACLSSEIAMSGRTGADRRAAVEVCRAIDAAHAIGCRLVKILDTTIRGERAASAIRMGHWLVPLGDYAAERAVTLVIENRLTFRRARDMWLMLESANHPALAAAWDPDHAAAIGEPSSVSVPTLNSRIQYAQITWTLGGDNPSVSMFLTRLLGIGYEGWVTLKGGVGDLQPMLREAIGKLREWGHPHHPSKAPAMPARQVVKH